MGNRKRLLQLLLVITLAVAGLVCACLYGRSAMLSQLNYWLDERGNFDISVYYPTEEISKYLEEDTRYSEKGRIYRIGQAAPAGKDRMADIGCFENELAIDMFHLPLYAGRYPEKTGEICVDRLTLQSWGYAAVNQEVELCIYSQDGKLLKTGNYLVVGIVELTVQTEYTTGSYRYNLNRTWEAYYPPAVYLSYEEVFRLCPQNMSDYIFLGNVAYSEKFDDRSMLLELNQKFPDIICGDFNGGFSRSKTALFITMQDNAFYADINNGYSANEYFMNSRTPVMDFYNAVLIPCFMLLFMFLTVCSVYSVFCLILQKRSEELKILRAIGLSLKNMLWMLVVETAVILLFCIGTGYLLGFGIYALSMLVQKMILHQKIYWGFRLDDFWGKYILRVTYNPYLMPWFVVLVVILIVFLLYLSRNINEQPLTVVEGEASKGKWLKWLQTTSHMLGVRYYAGIVLALASVIFAAAFGYLSCRVQSDKDAREWQEKMDSLDTQEYEYAALITVNDTLAGCNQIMHNSGITQESLQGLIQDENVEDYVCFIWNLSSKVVYDGKDEKCERLQSGNVRYNANGIWEDDPEDIWALRDAASWKYKGFAETDGIFQAPTLGFSPDYLQTFESSLVSGEIHEEEIEAGREVIVLVKEKDNCDLFMPGEILPMTDIIYEKSMDQNTVFQQGGVTNDMVSVEVIGGLDFYAYGFRQDFPVKVGGVALLDESDAKLFYRDVLIPDSGFVVATTMDAMQLWGLPDRNITNLYINLKNGTDRAAFERKWYSMLAESSNMHGYCLTDLEMNLSAQRRSSMLIFYFLFVLLVLIGAVCISNMITVLIGNARRNIGMVRAVGADRKMIKLQFLKKVIGYPIMATAIAAAALGLYMAISLYAQNKWNQVGVVIDGKVGEEWYYYFPIQNFSKYYPEIVLLLLMGLTILLIVLFSALQLKTLLLRSISDEVSGERE